MKQSQANISFKLIVTLSLALVCLNSHAIPIQTFSLIGNCEDCAAAAGTASHEVEISLTLRNYEIGNRIKRRNFHSFSYSGSNLVEDFSVSLGDWKRNSLSFLFGRIQDDYVAGDAFRFTLFTTDWRRRGRSGKTLWSCTDLGREVADPAEACMNTHRLFFSMSALGDWQLGIPAKDHGSVPHDDDQAVPEPGTLLLALLGLTAVRRQQLFRS